MAKHQPPGQKQPPQQQQPQRAAGASGNNATASGDGAGAPSSPKREAPIVTSFGVHEIPGEGWVALEYSTQNDKVLRVRPLGEPDIRMIAIGRVEARLRTPRED